MLHEHILDVNAIAVAGVAAAAAAAAEVADVAACDSCGHMPGVAAFTAGLSWRRNI